MKKEIDIITKRIAHFYINDTHTIIKHQNYLYACMD